jgi:hypothetical protein
MDRRVMTILVSLLFVLSWVTPIVVFAQTDAVTETYTEVFKNRDGAGGDLQQRQPTVGNVPTTLEPRPLRRSSAVKPKPKSISPRTNMVQLMPVGRTDVEFWSAKERGQTVWKDRCAGDYKCVEAIRDLNPTIDIDHIEVGQSLIVPLLVSAPVAVSVPLPMVSEVEKREAALELVKKFFSEGPQQIHNVDEILQALKATEARDLAIKQAADLQAEFAEQRHNALSNMIAKQQETLERIESLIRGQKSSTGASSTSVFTHLTEADAEKIAALVVASLGPQLDAINGNLVTLVRQQDSHHKETAVQLKAIEDGVALRQGYNDPNPGIERVITRISGHESETEAIAKTLVAFRHGLAIRLVQVQQEQQRLAKAAEAQTNTSVFDTAGIAVKRFLWQHVPKTLEGQAVAVIASGPLLGLLGLYVRSRIRRRHARQIKVALASVNGSNSHILKPGDQKGFPIPDHLLDETSRQLPLEKKMIPVTCVAVNQKLSGEVFGVFRTPWGREIGWDVIAKDLAESENFKNVVSNRTGLVFAPNSNVNGVKS